MTRVIVLAAGNGTRMNSDLPKVLVPLNGRPMISYLLESIKLADIDARPIVIVSPTNAEILKNSLAGEDVEFVVQEQQLGTGNAVSCAMGNISSEVSRVLVMYGDHPFFKTSSIKRIADSDPQPLAMMTTELPDFDDWRHNFYHWGRIIRDKNKQIVHIVEFKDGTEKEREITEVNPAVMCFNHDWLAKHITLLNNKNKSGEYYLTDLVKTAFGENRVITSISVEPHEAMGINSQEELKIAEEQLAIRK